jgi:isoamylase
MPWPGRPHPLGATWDGEGTNVAVFASEATSVDVVIDDGDGRRTLPLAESTYHIWHGYVPALGPGARYWLHVDGPHRPERGQFYNANVPLLDPYARAVEIIDSRPVGVVVDDGFDWGDERRPQTPWADSVIYEMHVKGFTAAHPDVPPRLRGTYAGLAHPAAVDHLRRLGVTAVELLPVHQFMTEPQLAARGLSNYWGYNTVGFFAPHGDYAAAGSSGGQVAEFKAMVRALHAAGIEVILDVVYNHTAEGGVDGPVYSLRGLDNLAYYRTDPDDPGTYVDFTGCGNTLDVRNPMALKLVMDSLRYWVTTMHVDGFRFDLASALLRNRYDVDRQSAFLQVIGQDPVLSRVKLIAEPWDLGSGGYQVGEFPPLWSEWNGRYRDSVRDFWRGTAHGVADLGFRLTGSSDLYQDDGRRPFSSVNFVTAHDGFTLSDLVAYDDKHNDANGEANRDGTDDNRSWNCGLEGETSDDVVNDLRARQRRNFMATLLLSAGVPMVAAGDEIGRTQHGNNNAYCQDNDLSYLDWANADASFADFVGRLIRLRMRHPALRRRAFYLGQPLGASGRKDLGWFRADGSEMTDHDWSDGSLSALTMFIAGDGIPSRSRRGEPIIDQSFALVINGSSEIIDVVLPGEPWAAGYVGVVDTADSAGASTARVRGGDRVSAYGRSLQLYRVATVDGL